MCKDSLPVTMQGLAVGTIEISKLASVEEKLTTGAEWILTSEIRPGAGLKIWPFGENAPGPVGSQTQGWRALLNTKRCVMGLLITGGISRYGGDIGGLLRCCDDL